MITKIRAQWMLSGLQQKTIAEDLGVQRSHVSEWMMGKMDIPPRHMPGLCNIFRCNPADLVGWTDEVRG